MERAGLRSSLDGSNDIQTGIFWPGIIFNSDRFSYSDRHRVFKSVAHSLHPRLVSWGFIGARTSASQPIGNCLVSSLPIGFKNTLRKYDQAIHAMIAAGSPIDSHISMMMDDRDH
jgi:phospho-2-dehydro-3-deoxyheptonate aldolase